MHQPRFRRTVHAIVFTGVCTMIAIPAAAQTPPDNTKVNTRDRAKGAVTADQQKENAGDREQGCRVCSKKLIRSGSVSLR